MTKYLVAEYSQLSSDLDNEGYSVAHFAVKSGNIQLLTLLQEKGVDLQLRSNLGETTLHLASKESKIFTCKYILNTTKSMGVTLVHSAASGGYDNLFEFYISRGLSIDDKTSEGKTVLNYAARHCRIEMCEIFEMFIYLGLEVDKTNAAGETVLHIACSNRKNRVR